MADIFVTFSDSSDDWLGFTQSTLTIETTDLGRQTLGTFGITVEL